MAQKKTEAAGAAATHGTETAGQAKGNGRTKLDAVREALKEMGKTAKPLAIRDFVKTRFGMDINTGLISTYKKELAGKRKGKRKRRGAKKHAAAKASTKAGAAPKAAAPAARTQAGKGGRSISLKDVAAVKELVGRVGAEELLSLIDLLAR
jgi:hypothetical protein